jgi:putative acetyltransferase
MSREVAIRDFTVSDCDAVLALWKASEGVGLNDCDTSEGITRYLARNPGLSLVAVEASGGIVGAVLCGHDGRRGYLHHLAVAASHRRGGVGTRLVDTCLQRLNVLGVMKCNIFLYADNAAGRAFWKKIGWSIRPDLVMVQRATN